MKNFFYSILGIVVISTTLYSAPNSGIQIIPIGGGSSGSLSITGAYNLASPPFSTNGVNVSISLSTSNLAGILSTNLYSQISIDPRMRRLANRPIPMGWAVNAGVTVAAGVTNQSWMIGVSEYLNTNGFAKLGYDTILFNCGALSSNRNASGELQINTNYFPLGGPGLVSAFASNNCYLGIFAQIRPSFGPDECGGSCITPATAYFDGYTLAKWGLRMVWIGDIQNGEAMSDESIRYSCEQFVAGLDAGTAELRNKLPVNVTVSWTGISALRGTNVYPMSWCPRIFNSMYLSYGNDIVTTGPKGHLDAYATMFSRFDWVSDETCLRTSQGFTMLNEGSAAAWMTTNYCRSFIGSCSIGPFPMFMGGTTPDLLEIPLIKNLEVIKINQDSLYYPARILSSNINNIVIYRKLANGDVALGLMNLLTNATVNVTLDITTVPGVITNRVGVIDIFDGLITSITNQLSVNVNTGGFNFYRILNKVTKGLSTNYVDALTGTNALVFTDGLLTQIVPTNSLPIMNGLRAWWKFNEGIGIDAYDSSGNGNLGTLKYPYPVWTNNSGVEGLYFNSNTFVFLPSSPSLNITGAMTMSAWVTPTMLPGESTITRFIIGGMNLNSPFQGYQLGMYVGNDGPGYQAGFADATATFSATSLTNRGRVLTSLVFTSNSNAVFYVNNLSVKTNSISKLPTSWFGNRAIGSRSSGADFFFNGVIDNVRLYNRELSLEEIGRIYNQEK